MNGLASLSVKRTCSYAGMVFPHDMEVCDKGKCMICKDGAFENYPEPRPPKYGLHVSPGDWMHSKE
jgi:hypothetical protein